MNLKLFSVGITSIKLRPNFQKNSQYLWVAESGKSPWYHRLWFYKISNSPTPFLRTQNNVANFPLPRGREANSSPCIPRHIPLVGPGSYPRGKPMTCALHLRNTPALQNTWQSELQMELKLFSVKISSVCRVIPSASLSSLIDWLTDWLIWFDRSINQSIDWLISPVVTGLLLVIHYEWAYMTYYLKLAKMAASKLEINFRRLLERCEAMAGEFQDNKENVSWRLEKVNDICDRLSGSWNWDVSWRLEKVNDFCDRDWSRGSWNWDWA